MLKSLPLLLLYSFSSIYINCLSLNDYLYLIQTHNYFYHWSLSYQDKSFFVDATQGLAIMDHSFVDPCEFFKRQCYDMDTAGLLQSPLILFWIYDGDYLDKTRVPVKPMNLTKEPILDVYNGTLQYESDIMKWSTGFRTDPVINCRANITFFFIDRYTNQPYNSANQSRDDIAIDFDIESKDCGFKMYAKNLSKDQMLTSHKEVCIYFVLQGIASILILLQLEKLHKNYSFWFKEATGFCIIGVCILITYQIMLVVAIFVTWHFVSWLLIIASLGLFALIFIVEACTIARDILPVLSFILILTFSIFWMLVLSLEYLIIFCFLVYTLHPLPQIFGLLFKEETKLEILINWCTYGGLKFFYIAYLKLYSENIFRLSPNPILVYSCGGLLFLQWAVLMFLANRSRAKRMKISLVRGILNEAYCPICLEEFNLSPKEILKTPCHHEFHAKCLKNCISRDSRCPMCRKVIQQDVLAYLLNC